MTDRLGSLGIRGQKQKQVKNYSYRKEKMMLRKQEEKGVPLSAEQSDWLHDTDEEPDEQELEAQYMYMAKIQEVLQVTDDNFRPTYDTEPLEQVPTNNEYNVFAKDRIVKCVFNSIHDAYVSKFLNDMNARSKKPQVVPIRHRKPIRKLNQSVATPPKKIVASDPTIQKSRSYYRMLYEKTSKIVQIILFIVDSGCTKHMTGNLKLLCNFVEIYLGKNDIVKGLPKLKFVKDQLCSSCEIGKAKRNYFKSLTVTRSKKWLDLLHMDLSGPMRIETINGKKYILNGVVVRWSRTLVKAARTMLSASKLPLFFWDEAIATALRDDENLDKIKEKGDPCIFVGYSTTSRGY
ncbi:hypothetical protein Tco_1079660 [Tanacetum coccineum]|uniref:Uncharacterized protein n=1 Tax=Tanacetum coccineum TaxID=301880 RepID=A0ABQ5HT45_9ASTR